MISCRQCGGPHLTISCPLRFPEVTPKPWRQQQDEFAQREKTKPFKCTVPLHPGKNSVVFSDSIAEFWEEIRVSYEHSPYRDFVGILKAVDDGDGAGDVLFPPDYAFLNPGEYELVSRTHGLSIEDLSSVIADGVSVLKIRRPLSEEQVKAVQSKLLLMFNHFSLSRREPLEFRRNGDVDGTACG